MGFRHFDPPYSSPLEAHLAWELSKHLSGLVDLLKQLPVETRLGRFFVDLVLATRVIAPKKVGKHGIFCTYAYVLAVIVSPKLW